MKLPEPPPSLNEIQREQGHPPQNDWIAKTFYPTVGFSSVWIGLSDTVKQNNWVWVSGDKSTYRNWAKNEPSKAAGYDYVRMVWRSATTADWATTWFSSTILGLFERVDAVSSTFGKGCSSTTTTPTIFATPPQFGKRMTVSIKGFLPKAQFGQLILGLSNTRWGIIPLPLPMTAFGMGNCSLLVSPDVSALIVTDSFGNFQTTFLVPKTPALAGVSVYMQAWAPDPKANVLGVALTNATAATLGH